MEITPFKDCKSKVFMYVAIHLGKLFNGWELTMSSYVVLKNITSCKVNNFDLITYLNQIPIFKWYVVWQKVVVRKVVVMWIC